MKHKTELKKGLARVSVEGAAETGRRASDRRIGEKPAGVRHIPAGVTRADCLPASSTVPEVEMEAGSAVLRTLGGAD